MFYTIAYEQLHLKSLFIQTLAFSEVWLEINLTVTFIARNVTEFIEKGQYKYI